MRDRHGGHPPMNGRDPRLDVFRGLALVMIFINHVPGTVFEALTSRNFGFSDAAEGFVIMSGIAAGIAYSPAFISGPMWPALARMWHRAGVIYLIHLLTTLLSIAAVATGALWLDATGMLGKNNFAPIFSDPLGTQIGIPLLTHQIGYANVLPLYAVLLLAAPFAMLLGLRWPRALLIGSFALWALAGTQWLNLPNFPNKGGWFFNPLAWQVIFVVGLLTGIHIRKGERMFPVYRWAQWLAAGYLLLALLVLKVPSVGAVFGSALWQIQETGVHRLFTAFDKTYVTLPRLLHILALAYLIGSLPAVRGWVGVRAFAPLALLGRHSLPVFALGTVLAYVSQVIKEVTPETVIRDGVILLLGLLAQFLLAWLKDRYSMKSQSKRKSTVVAS